MKKYLILGALFALTTNLASAYGVVGAPNCPNLSQYGNSKYFLSKGMRDRDTQAKRDISELQNFLANKYGLAPSDAVTGYFGKTTEAYVKKYQKENGLPQSGMVGQLTRKSLANEVVCKVSVNQGENTPMVVIMKTASYDFKANLFNLPKDSYIELFDSETGKKYDGIDIYTTSAGNSSFSLIPTKKVNGLTYTGFIPKGSYYVQVSYQDVGKTTTIKSAIFTVSLDDHLRNSY